jgi:hypothetical protein
MDALSQLLRENIEWYMTDVHTALAGVIKKYDPATRRADIQPSVKRKLPGGKYLDFPVVPDVPVLFPGSKKYTLHFPLEEGDEVLLIASERGTDSWKAKGGKGIEEADPRRFDLQDCYAIPGLQVVDFIPVSEAGLNIVHKTKPDGELVSQVTMDDDKVEMVYKKNATVTMEDDHIVCRTEKCKVELSSDVAELANSQTSFKLDGDKFAISNGGKSLFTILDTLLTKLQGMKTVGSPAQHTVFPSDIQAFAQLQQDVGALLEA